MKRFLLAASALLALSVPAQASTTIEGTATGINVHNADPGLVITASAIPFGPFTLDLEPGGDPSFFITDLLTVGTNEGTVNLFEDTTPYSISIDFSFANPFDVSGSPLTGQTYGIWLFDVGVVDWGSPVVFNFGSGGAFSLELFDTHFGTPGTATVSGKFKLISESAVPEPGTWAMMLMGFGAVGFAMRRRREYPLAQVA